ncbi:nucleotidyltransferase [Clostridium sp.]|uniref:nucleotidyltransferase n=1 Tax=Clostridium sp. TaxID=1506 RepID=UPI003463F5E0
MKISAIISEYNPFHSGHLYHIKKTKSLTEDSKLIVLMSGNFTQRGIPSMIDKWNRAKIAVLNGADLVLELPTLFSLSSAEFFAKGAVSILNGLNSIDYLSFGSEWGDINNITLISEILSNEPLKYKSLLKGYLNKGLPFTTSRNLALKDYLKENSMSSNTIDNIISSPNNILAIEYCKSLIKLNSNIKPLTIERIGGGYNDSSLNPVFSSATSIRDHLRHNKDLNPLKSHMPKASYDILSTLKDNNYDFVFEEKIFPFIKYKLLCNKNNLSLIPEASEGLDNKILKELINSSSLNELILKIKSKRYTYTRISRILCQYFVGIENYDILSLRESYPDYIRPLAFNENGIKILKNIKLNSETKILSRVPKDNNPFLQLDLLGTRAYSLLCNTIEENSDFLTPPFILK